jgi:hypothetical protein
MLAVSSRNAHTFAPQVFSVDCTPDEKLLLLLACSASSHSPHAPSPQPPRDDVAAGPELVIMVVPATSPVQQVPSGGAKGL